MANLVASSFPPGSPIPYVDAMLKQQDQVVATEKKTDQNTLSIESLNETVIVIREDLNETTQTANAAKTAADQAIADAKTAQDTATQAVDDAKTAQDTAQGAVDAIEVIQDHAIFDNVSTPQNVTGTFGAQAFTVAAVQVVGARKTGFSAPSGTAAKAGINGDAAYAVGAAYSQAEVQALAVGLVEARRTIAALQQVLLDHGLTGV